VFFDHSERARDGSDQPPSESERGQGKKVLPLVLLDLSLDLIINLILEHCRLFLQLDQHLRPSLVGFSLSPHLEENIAPPLAKKTFH
jgi:hypothetical protein